MSSMCWLFVSPVEGWECGIFPTVPIRPFWGGVGAYVPYKINRYPKTWDD